MSDRTATRTCRRCPPVDGENVAQVVRRLLTDGIAPLSVVAPDAPGEVASLVDRMLSREPALRPDDLREVAATLSRYAPELHVPAFGAPGALAVLPAAPSADLTPLPRARPSVAVVVIASGVVAAAALGWSLRSTGSAPVVAAPSAVVPSVEPAPATPLTAVASVARDAPPEPSSPSVVTSTRPPVRAAVASTSPPKPTSPEPPAAATPKTGLIQAPPF